MDSHKPLPRNTPLDDQHLIRYLLGLLPPHEADRFDEMSVVDDEIAARLRGVEDDLVDAYVRGTLAVDLRERFESYYLASPRRRERMAFAVAFARAIDEAPRKVAAPSWRLRWRWRPVLLPALAVAAALLLVASGGLLFESVRLGRGLSIAESSRVALDRRARDLEQQNADLRAANAEIAQQLERARAPVAVAAPDAKAIALVLLPQTRSAGTVPVLNRPAAADRVGFELRLEANEFDRYQVGLRDPTSNDVVWRSDWVGARASAEGASVRVAVPHSLLKPQHYTLDLAGRTGSDTAHVVGSYAFEVVPR